MKYVYVDAGNDPDWATLAKHKIDGCFFDVRDPRLSASYLNAVKAKGYAVGVYVVDSWPETKNLTGSACAEWMNAAVDHAVNGKVTASFPKVQLDYERHDADWIGAALTRWRELRPKQDTSWTLEGFQGGWARALAALCRDLNIRVAPQAYNGAMDSVWDSLAVARDLTKAGFEDSRISPIWDAAHLPAGWNGWAFSMGRLPQ